MRTISLAMRQALFAQDSGETPVFLLTITHPQLAEPIRLSSDPTERLTTDPLRYGTTSGGETFYFVDMQVSLPDEKDKSPPACQLIIPNVDRDIIPLARSVQSPASARIQVVLASSPDDIEIEVPALDMVGVEYDAMSLSFSLAMDGMSSEPYPALTFSPAYFPGLFV